MGEIFWGAGSRANTKAELDYNIFVLFIRARKGVCLCRTRTKKKKNQSREPIGFSIPNSFWFLSHLQFNRSRQSGFSLLCVFFSWSVPTFNWFCFSIVSITLNSFAYGFYMHTKSTLQICRNLYHVLLTIDFLNGFWMDILNWGELC